MKTDPDGVCLSVQFLSVEKQKESERVSEEKESIRRSDSSMSSCLTLISTAALDVLQSDNHHLTLRICEVNHKIHFHRLWCLLFILVMNLVPFGARQNDHWKNDLFVLKLSHLLTYTCLQLKLDSEFEELARQLRELSTLSYGIITDMQDSGEQTGMRRYVILCLKNVTITCLQQREWDFLLQGKNLLLMYFKGKIIFVLDNCVILMLGQLKIPSVFVCLSGCCHKGVVTREHWWMTQNTKNWILSSLWE